METGERVMLHRMLELTPLTKLLVGDRSTIRDARFMADGRWIELPYWFYQYTNQHGELVASSPGGYLANLAPTDVFDMIPAEPIRVKALSAPAYLRHLKANSHGPAAPEYFTDASVIMAFKDRWGGFDYRVRFDDPDLNTSSTYFAPIPKEDRERIAKLINRRNIPVVNYRSSSPWSADQVAKSISLAAEKKTRKFFAVALSGDARRTTKLATAEI